MSQATPEETTALLTRLSQKPGVTSTLILRRDTGAIVRASGLLSSAPSQNPPSAASSAQNQTSAPPSAQADTAPAAPPTPAPRTAPDARGLKSAEDVARVVWAFFGRAGETVAELMGPEDEARLVRLRTRRNEIVVVPDAKFLLVCVHDTPLA